MGTEYYLVSDQTKEVYELGRSLWIDIPFRPSFDEIRKMGQDIMENKYEADPGTARRFGRELAEWASDRGDGEVRIVTDSEEEYRNKVMNYETTGSVYELRTMTKEDIRQRVEEAADKLRDELGADVVNLSVEIEDMPVVDDQDETIIWEYSARSCNRDQSSGFRKLIRKNEFFKVGYEPEDDE